MRAGRGTHFVTAEQDLFVTVPPALPQPDLLGLTIGIAELALPNNRTIREICAVAVLRCRYPCERQFVPVHQEARMSVTNLSSVQVIPAEALLQHWQGHRRLTRGVIEAFPEDQLFTFSIGGMRTFGAMSLELIAIAAPMVRGIVTGDWQQPALPGAPSKSEILQRWHENTDAINDLWPQIPPERFSETVTAFGQYPGRVYDLLLYAIDNEIHHRGQGYVYLRALGIDPPPFYNRE